MKCTYFVTTPTVPWLNNRVGMEGIQSRASLIFCLRPSINLILEKSQRFMYNQIHVRHRAVTQQHSRIEIIKFQLTTNGLHFEIWNLLDIWLTCRWPLGDEKTWPQQQITQPQRASSSLTSTATTRRCCNPPNIAATIRTSVVHRRRRRTTSSRTKTALSARRNRATRWRKRADGRHAFLEDNACRQAGDHRFKDQILHREN